MTSQQEELHHAEIAFKQKCKQELAALQEQIDLLARKQAAGEKIGDVCYLGAKRGRGVSAGMNLASLCWGRGGGDVCQGDLVLLGQGEGGGRPFFDIFQKS